MDYDPNIQISLSGSPGCVVQNIELFEKSPRTYSVDAEIVEGFGIYPIPTFISVCPYCKTENKWRTTGIIVPHRCENCNKYFNVW